MLAHVYKSLKKADTYLYLAARDDFARLPEPLRSQLGALQFVLEVAAGRAAAMGIAAGTEMRHPSITQPAWPCE